MANEPDAYDYLATSKVSELTVAQLEQALENSYLNKSNIEFWKGPIVMHKLLEVSRTYPGAGMPIPELGVCVASGAMSGFEFFDFKPQGTEVWRVLALSATAASGTPGVGVFAYDGTTSVTMGVTTSSISGVSVFNELLSPDLFLTNSLYLRVANLDAAIVQIFEIAYQVVSV